MSKIQTCAEIIKEMMETTPNYPYILKVKGTQKELIAKLNEEDKTTWDVFSYKSHGYIFTKVAQKLTTKSLAELEYKLNNR